MLMSGKHCTIERETDDASKAFLVDHSTNGTLINLKNKIHKNKYLLSNNDLIYLVIKKNEPEKRSKTIKLFKDIVFKFELSSKLTTKPNLFAQTLAYNCLDFNEEADEVYIKNQLENSPTISNRAAAKFKFEEIFHEENSESKKTSKKFKTNDKDDQASSALTNEIAPQASNRETKEMLSEENDVVENKPDIKDKKIDKFAESLNCPICDEIMHDSIALVPCLHGFCAGCYSEWMDQSDECPTCRQKVKQISKNHKINQIIENFLIDNPSYKRSDEDIKSLDEKNKITRDMLYPSKNSKVTKYEDDYEESEGSSEKEKSSSGGIEGWTDDEDDEYNEDQDETEDEEEYIPPRGFAYNALYRPPVFNNFNNNLNFGYNNFNNPFRFYCRQCPQNRLVNPQVFNGVIAPNYICTQQQNHILCQCCLEAFPDRANEIAMNGLLPKQSCSLCFKPFCDLYWGCRKFGCKRCLVRFCNYEPDQNECFNSNLILDNRHETQLFSDWFVRKNKTIKQIFDECMNKVKDNEYKLSGINDADAVLCRSCCLTVFKDLSYQYRKDIPKTEIFNNGNSNPNCYYGKNCRTQKHNADHQRYLV